MIGKFITFEGGEGVGKTTQIELLAAKIKSLDIPVKTTREPGGTPVGEELRNLLKTNSDFKNLDPLSECLMMFAIRRDHFKKVIKPLLENGFVVICDRFYDSTLVYQGLLKNVSYKDIMELKNLSLKDFEPDLTFILDIDPKISSLRLKNRAFNLLDSYDLMEINEHNIIRDGFKKIAEIFSYRARLINANKTPDKIFDKIFEIVAPMLEELQKAACK